MPDQTFTLDAYAVRSCPLKALYRFHPGFERPSAQVPPSPYAEQARAFDDEVLSQFRALPGAVDCSHMTRDETEAVFATAAPVVVRAMFPGPGPSHRAGRIDVVLRTGFRKDGKPGYVPVEIKFHQLVTKSPDHNSPLLTSAFSDPLNWTPKDLRFKWNFRVGDLLHISHDWRLLEDAGLAAENGACAGLVGTDKCADIVWLDLKTPVIDPNPRVLADPEFDQEPITILDRYDYELDFRIQAVTDALMSERGDPPSIRPIMHYECSYCVWFPTCRPQLDDDDISVVVTKARFDLQEIRAMRSLGIETATQLAAADLEELLPQYLPHVTHRDGTEERIRLAQHRCQMAASGIRLERTTTGTLPLPEHQLEIDFDIETNGSERVYLWGFYVADGIQRPYYRQFSIFTEVTDEAEQALAIEAMSWLRELVDAQPDVAIYHYSPYEVKQIRRLAKASGDPALLWAMDSVDRFVDLFPIVKANFFGLDGFGLKVMATEGAGYDWRDIDPSGLNSISWFDEACYAESPQVRELARLRVLEYNEDDVRATRALRRWLRSLD